MRKIYAKPYIDHGLQIIEGKAYYMGELWTGAKLLVSAGLCLQADSGPHYRYDEDMAQIKRLGLEEEFMERWNQWDSQ